MSFITTSLIWIFDPQITFHLFTNLPSDISSSKTFSLTLQPIRSDLKGVGAKKRRGGGATEVLPLRTGESVKVLAMLKVGGEKVLA